MYTIAYILEYAVMAELADALDSGSSARKGVEVRVLLTAPYIHMLNPCAARVFCYYLYNQSTKKEMKQISLKRSRLKMKVSIPSEKQLH